MKMYIITQAQLDDLPKRIEMAKLRQNEGRDIHDPVRQETDDLFRTFHFHVQSWIREVASER